MRAQLEGRLPEDALVLLIDDVTTDGLSKIAAASALRQTGTRIDDTLVLVAFDVYPRTAARFAADPVAWSIEHGGVGA